MTQPLARGVVRVFRLTDEPGGLGLSCTPAGVSLAGVPLLRKAQTGFALRPASEIAALLKAAYGEDPTGLQSRLGVIAQALNSGDIAKAMIAAVHTRTPELSPEAALRLAKADRELGKYNYDPNEPRDWHGRWTRDGSTASSSIAAPGIQNDQGDDQYASARRQRVAESGSATTTDAAASSNSNDGDAARDAASLKETFERKYDDLGPVDFARQVIEFGDRLGRSSGKLSSDEKARALAEYSFLQDRLSFWLYHDSKSITAEGNLLSAAQTLYQGAINGGVVQVGHLPRSMLAVAGMGTLLSGGPAGRPYKAPSLEEAPIAAARPPKVEGLGDIGAVETPVQITLRGVEHAMPDWHMQEISYTKRTDAARLALRAEFIPVREAFVKDLAENHAAELRDAGISDDDIAKMVTGQAPLGYEVHHKLPLDDGGTNATNNLVLIKSDPDHQLITQYQRQQTRGMSAGETRTLEWPMPDLRVRIWPKTPGGGAYPIVGKLKWPMADSRVRIWPKIPDGGAYLHRALTRRASMSDIDDLLGAIYAKEQIPPPASQDAIERLRRIARDRLRTDLAEDYVKFLGRHDGLVFNGYAIYAANEQKKLFRPGFVESNERLGGPDDGYVYYGENSITQYAQDRTSRAWVALDVPSWDVVATFPSFDAMLAQVLRDATAFLTRGSHGQ